jgi:hypothetical protein
MQKHGESGAPFGRVSDGDHSAPGLDTPFRDRETEADTRGRSGAVDAGSTFAAASEWCEDRGALRDTHPSAVVIDVDGDAPLRERLHANPHS